MQSIEEVSPGGYETLDLDIGVIYTHERQFMPRLLGSLHASGEGLRKRLLLVDNCSDDGVEPYLEYFPETEIIENSQRLGYAANLNRILQRSTARYTLLLNTDMYFDPDSQCLARMVRFMDEHPDCGVSGCALRHDDGVFAYPARQFQSIAVVLARRFGLGRFMSTTIDQYLYRDRPIEASWECDWLSGCFLMVRREAFEEVGFLDERFRKYFEDVDFCYRMSRNGWRVMYYGGAWCYHLERRDSQRIFSRDGFLHLCSYLRWHRKWGMAPWGKPRQIEPKRKAA
jgi:GT2 family glycosyltransferase